MLRCDEVPSVGLPTLSMSLKPLKVRKPPMRCEFVDTRVRLPSETACTVSMAGDHTDAADDVSDASTQTEDSLQQLTEELTELKLKVDTLTKELEKKEQQLRSQTLRLSHIVDNDVKVAFYTGFPSYKVLDSCYTVHELCYIGENGMSRGKRCRSRALPPLEKFFLTLVRLRLGLMEEDIADRFAGSQLTLSCVITTWVNFLFLKFKEILL